MHLPIILYPSSSFDIELVIERMIFIGLACFQAIVVTSEIEFILLAEFKYA
jgi:hypothetical protein